MDVIPDNTIANFLYELGAPSSNGSVASGENTADKVKIATVFNLSTSPLEEDVTQLLQKGLKFVPSPSYLEGEETELQADLDHLASKIRGRCNHLAFTTFSSSNVDQPQKKSFVKPSAVKPSKATKDPPVASSCQQIAQIKPQKNNKMNTNMGKNQYEALKQVKQNQNVVIKEADKGSGVVIMEKDYYISAIETMLQDTTTYAIIDDMTCTKLTDIVKKFNKKWESVLTAEEIKAINENPSSMATFYGLPKIHKSTEILAATRNTPNSVVIECPEPSDLKFRPIISCRQCPTTKLCEVLNNILQPFLSKVTYRLKDTYDFLRKCPKTANDDTYLITADITALYTNITTEKGLEAISYYIDNYGEELLPSRFTKDFVMDLFTFCQNNLYFKFKDVVYRQISGTGMGRIYAPAAADLKVGYQEIQVAQLIKEKLGERVANHFTQNYFRYLDDVFMVWRLSLPEITIIINILNSVDPNIVFTFESSRELHRQSGGIPFLDVEVYTKDNQILFDLFSKTTDTFNYLPFGSSHPRHCTRNIPYCLARRIVAFVSESSNVTKRLQELRVRLSNKGYPRALIDDGISKARLLCRDTILYGTENATVDQANVTQEPVYFVSTFNPKTKNLRPQINNIISNLNLTLPVGKSISVQPSYRKSPSLKDQLMYRPLTQSQVQKCGKDCIFCGYITTGSSVKLKNGMEVHTNGNFECSSRNVIYIATCDGCSESYVGETGDQLLTRWTVHRQQSKLQPSQAPVHADVHFRICGKNKYSVFPFFRPKRNNIFLRRRYEELFITRFRPKLNGKLYS